MILRGVFSETLLIWPLLYSFPPVSLRHHFQRKVWTTRDGDLECQTVYPNKVSEEEVLRASATFETPIGNPICSCHWVKDHMGALAK